MCILQTLPFANNRSLEGFAKMHAALHEKRSIYVRYGGCEFFEPSHSLTIAHWEGPQKFTPRVRKAGPTGSGQNPNALSWTFAIDALLTMRRGVGFSEPSPERQRGVGFGKSDIHQNVKP